MIYKVSHTTRYDYSDSVSLSHHLLRLSPRNLQNQRCLNSDFNIEPKPSINRQHTDYFGNSVAFVTLEGAHKSLTIHASSTVSVTRPALPAAGETLTWESVRDFGRGLQIGAALDASEFVYDSPLIKTNDDFAAYALPSFPSQTPVLEAVMNLTGRIYKDFKFDPKATTLATPLHEVFRQRRGVCQDFAHLQIACLRSLGLPARYVSGYLETDPPPGKPRLAGADASHAWISFYCHGIGWIDVDPTNNQIPDTRHITVAWGRDYSDVSPVRGVILGTGAHRLKVSVDVLPAPPPAAAERAGITTGDNPPEK